MAFIVTAEVQHELHFDEFRRAIEISVNKALIEGAKIVLEEVVAAETRIGDASERRRISPGVHLKDTFQATVSRSSFGSFGGFSSIIVWSDNPNAIWQELGTRGRRRKHLKSGGINHTSENRGVAPLYFMRRGLRRALPEVEALLATALHNVGQFGPATKIFDTNTPRLVE